ncbi:MAG: hypothetical protein WCJ58_00265 [bacterium]
MFGFKRPNTDDPQAAIDQANKTMNSGITGGLTKMFMGKDFVNKANDGLATAQSAMDDAKEMQELMVSGVDAKALVKTLADTGKLINFNPVLQMKLEVNPGTPEAYELDVEKMVSKIMIPRIGDTLMLKVSPTDKQKIAIMGIMPPTPVAA